MSDLDTQISVTAVTLTDNSGQRTANIIEQVIQIDLYENILAPFFYAEIKIQDTTDLLNDFPIIGEETVEFQFQSTDSDLRKIKMKVYSIGNKVTDENRAATYYTLRLTSPELFKAASYTIQRKYTDQISNIIQNILDDISDKEIKVEDTKGVEEVTIPQTQPLKSIDWLRQRAISPDYKSSSYCLYENKNGLNFKTIEGMFVDGKDKIGNKVFYFDSNQREDIRAVRYRNVIAYEQVRLNKTIDTIASGALKNSVTQYDILTGEIKKKVFEDPEFEGPDARMKSLNSNTFKDDFMEGITKTFFTFVDSSKPETDLPDKISYLQSFANKIAQNLLWIWVPGDSAITVGDVIQCNLPKTGNLRDDNAKDALYSGNYLVAKCRHMIQISAGTTANYTMSMELIKGSLMSGS